MNIKQYDSAIYIKVTKAQHNALKAKAKKLGISVSELIRSVIGLK